MSLSFSWAPDANVCANCGLRYAGDIWLHLLIGHLYLVGVRLAAYQRTNTIKTLDQKRLDCVIKFYWLFHTQYWTPLGGPMYSIEGLKENALSITITKSRDFQFPIWFFVVFYHRFAPATQDFKRKCDNRRWKSWKMGHLTPAYLKAIIPFLICSIPFIHWT